MAVRAQAKVVHGFLRHAGLGKLQGQSSGHVEEMLTGMVGLRAAQARPWKRGFKSIGHLGANFEAAVPDPGADCDDHAGRIHAEFVLHAR